MKTSTFPGGMRPDEILVGTASSTSDKELAEAQKAHPNPEIRFGNEVDGTNGKKVIPIFAKHP